MDTDLIIFGAGKTSASICEWIKAAGCHVAFFVDNDSSKWGKRIDGIEVKSPDELRKYNYSVVLPERFQMEMEKQLNSMMYQGRRIGIKQLKKEIVCSGLGFIDKHQKTFGNDIGFVFDSYFNGMNWGGIESYSCLVAGGLSDIGVRTQILCGMNPRFDTQSKNCLHFKEEEDLLMIKKMAVEIEKALPCVFITHGSVALYAAQLIKAKYPDKMQIVFVTHGDIKETYEMIHFWSDKLDRIICISEKIRRTFIEHYGINKKLLAYRPNPINILDKAEKRRESNGTLKIGFAARLTERQKRVHLLPSIIEECIKRKLNVEFNIAGEGEAKDRLVEYVDSRKLQHAVHILGWISPEKMTDFWKEQDVYLNISDFEGMSLAMLESMACGTVPIVTDVSGVSDLIEDGKNGFVVPVDGWLETIDKIENLSRNREMLQRAGECNMTLVREKCSLEDYAEWLVREFCI